MAALATMISDTSLAAEEPEKLNVLGTEIQLKTDGKRANGAMAVAESLVKPGAPPKHVHAKEDEMFYVLEGQFRIWRGDEVLDASTGAVAFLPRNVPHTYQNTGTARDRLLVTITLAGFEGFFREVSRRELSAPKDMQELDTLAKEYGLQFLGPPPQA
jgi:mannose-6-phosphate isomerase-like protein (cupin superfamily)